MKVEITKIGEVYQYSIITSRTRFSSTRPTCVDAVAAACKRITRLYGSIPADATINVDGNTRNLAQMLVLPVKAFFVFVRTVLT